jgi:hypothetical protein
MRLLRVRPTLWLTMIAVAMAGVFVRHLMATSGATPDAVYHVRRYPDTGRYCVRVHRLLAADEKRPMTYRSKYWRSFLGLPLTDDPCLCKAYFEMVEKCGTIDVQTTLDGSLGKALCEWLEYDPYNLPKPAHALQFRPQWDRPNGVRRATARPATITARLPGLNASN